MLDIKKTIKELNDITAYLKGKVDSTTAYADPAEKTAWEKRINDLKTNDSTHELSLTGLEQLDTNFALQITQLIQEKTQLEAQKKLAETERDNKTSLITTKEAELAQKETELQAKITEITGLTEAKLTKDLIDKINALNIDPTNLTEIKSSLVEMTKGLQVAKEKSEKLPAWSIYTIFAVSIFSSLLIIYQTFFKDNKKAKDDDTTNFWK